MSRYEWNPQCALICQNLTFKNRVPQLTSSQSDRSLRLANSQTTIIHYQLHFSRLKSQTVIHLNTKRGEKLLNQPLSYFYEKQYHKNQNQSQSNITYLQPTYQQVSPQRRMFYSPQTINTYRKLDLQSLSKVQQNLIQIQIQRKSYRSSRQNPQHTFLIEQNSRSTNKISKPTHNLSYEQQQSGQIPQSQQLIQPKSSKSEIKNSKSQSQMNSNKPQSQQQQQPESNKSESRQQSVISNKPQYDQPNEQQEINQQPQLVPLASPILIDQLYNVSWRKRHVEAQFKYFLRDSKSNFQQLCKNYSIRSSEIKNRLSKICQQFTTVRGDGNCFYTAFGYQFLLILLTKYSNEQYNQFINEYKQKIEFKISYHNDFKIESQEDQQQISQFFYGTLDQLLKYRNNGLRKDELYRRFSAHFQEDEHVNGLFYGASTIFFRNLINYLEQFSEIRLEQEAQSLLKWEEECNSNEIVINILAQKLNLFVQLLFFDNFGNFDLKEYGNKDSHKIILLMKPGHYNIGLCEENEVEQK